MFLPKVYLQIPHYNNAPYLQECFESCQRLTYPLLDIHFFNDSSTDNTFDVLNELDTEKIQIHKNTERLGRVKNYQYAFSHHGDASWCINLDSDDYYTSSSWIDEAMDIVCQHADDRIVHIQSNLLCFIPYEKCHILKNYGNGYCLISGIDYLELCIKHYSFSHLSSIFNIELVQQYGAYIDDCLHTDFFTAMRAAIHGNVLISDRQIGVWRKHDGNQSDTRYTDIEYTKNQITYYQFFEWCENYIPFERLKVIVQLFEKREFEKKIHTLSGQKRIKEVVQIAVKEKEYAFSTIFILLKQLIDLTPLMKFYEYETFSNISIGIITKIISVTITIATLPFIIQCLGIQNYGWVGFYTALVSAIYIFDFGLTNIITKEIAQHKDSSQNIVKTIIGTQESIYFGIGLIIFSILFFSAPFIAHEWIVHKEFSSEFSISIIRLISVAIFLQWPHSFYTGVLFGFHKQSLSNTSQLILSGLKNIGIILVLTHVANTIYVFFYWQIFISLITLIIQKFFIYREVGKWNLIPYFSTEYISSIKKVALGISLIAVFSFVYTDLNNLLLAKWLNLSEYGYYNILLNIVLAMVMYCATVKNALFPNISLSVRTDLDKDVYEKYIQYLRIICYTLIPPSIFLSVLNFEIVYLWFNDNTLASAISPSIPWITLGSLANSLMVIPWAFLIAKHKTKYLIYQCGFLALFSIPILYYLVQQYGLLGASIYWFIINVIPFIVIQMYFNSLFKDIPKHRWWTSFINALLLSGILLVIYYVTTILFHHQIYLFAGFICLILSIIGFGIFYKKYQSRNIY